jgi:hypothetical protein
MGGCCGGEWDLGVSTTESLDEDSRKELVVGGRRTKEKTGSKENEMKSELKEK